MPLNEAPTDYLRSLDRCCLPSLFEAAAERCRELSRDARTADEAAALWEAADLSADLAADLGGTLAAIEEARGFPAIVGRKHEIMGEAA